MKKIKIFILLFIIFSSNNVKAICDNNLNISLANNVAYTYQYNGSSFDITFTNLENLLYIVDQNNNYYGGFSETTIYNLSPNKTYSYKVYSSSFECDNTPIRTISIKLPPYNMYYDLDICKDNSEFKYCKKWYNNKMNIDELEAEIEKYNLEKENNIVNKAVYKNTTLNKIGEIIKYIYTNYYYLLLPMIIIISIFIIYRLDKKDSLF